MKHLVRTLIIVFVMALTVGIPVFAQGNLQDASKHLSSAAKEAGTTEGSIANIVGISINAILTLVGLVFLVLMVYAGLLWMTARGESDQVDKAKKIMTQSVIGLILVMSAYAITVLVTTNFSK